MWAGRIQLGKKVRGSRLFLLVLPKQDVESSNPFTRSSLFFILRQKIPLSPVYYRVGESGDTYWRR
jgi:hypothetical protein